MNHELAAKVIRLKNLALQYERGDLDAEFAAAKAPVADMRATVVQRLRELADALEAGA